MKNIDQYKIPIFEGINDQPLPPNYNNNNRGPNGSYFTLRFNGLIDALTGLDYAQNFSVSGYDESTTLEVGVPLLIDSGSLIFKYNLNKIDSISSVNIYANDTKINAEGTLDIVENGTYEYSIQSSTDPLIYSSTESDVIWRLEVITTSGEIFTREVAFYWRFKTIFGFSSARNIVDFNDNRISANYGSTVGRPSTITKSSSEIPLYTYIFLPNSYSEYVEFRINGFKVDMNKVTQNIFYFGELRPYIVYSSFYPTKGAYTLHLI